MSEGRADPRVILIGGAPGAGKTTLGAALAERLGYRSLTIDDLVTAAQAVTTPDSHPGLHLMWKVSAVDYFTETAPEVLIDDAKRQHEVAWPMIEAVIRKYVRDGTGVVIDGWHLWPDRVASLGVPEVWAGWLVIDPEALERRERANQEWRAGSTDPERMLANFLARSLWANQQAEARAREHDLAVIQQPGTASVTDLCDRVLGHIRPG
jgi:2-phosphoglycerate kinase